MGQTTLIQRRTVDEAVVKTGETIEEMDKEIEYKDSTIKCLPDKARISYGKYIKQTEKVILTEIFARNR